MKEANRIRVQGESLKAGRGDSVETFIVKTNKPDSRKSSKNYSKPFN